MPRTLSESEFNDVKATVLAGMPSGLTEAEFNRQVGPRMAAALGTAEYSSAPPEGSAVARGASELYNKSVVAPVVDAVGGAVNVAKHPLDTLFGAAPLWNVGKGLLKAHWDQAVQAAQKAKAAAGGDPLSAVEALGHGLAAVIPALGPAAADVGEHGARGDIAGMVGGATALVAPFAVKAGLEARRAGGLPTQANMAAADQVKARRLDAEAEQQVAQNVLAPGNPKYKGTAAALAPEVLDRGMQGDRLALRQLAEDGMDDAGGRIDAAVNQFGPQQKVSPQPVIARLNKQIAAYQPTGKTNPTMQGRVDALAELRDHLVKAGPSITFEKLRDLRDQWYEKAAENGGYAKAGGDAKLADSAWAAREGGAAIREFFGSIVPDLKGANADYTFFRNLDKVLDPTLGRPKNMAPNQVGVTGGAMTQAAVVAQALSNSGIPGLAPAAAFTIGKVLPALREAQASPGWQLASAQSKRELASAIRKGDTSGAKMILTKITRYAPRDATALPLAASAGTSTQEEAAR